MNISVDNVIKELEKYKGMSINKISIEDINIKMVIKKASKIKANQDYYIDENDEHVFENTIELEIR